MLHLLFDLRALLGVYGRTGEFMSANLPELTDSTFAPSFWNVPAVTNLPEKMPIDPVSVPGSATMSWPAIAM